MKRRAIKITFFSLVGVFVSLTLIGFIFQDKIIDAALQSIRKNIRSRITIGDASFSLIKNFPYASVKLSNVSILSTKDVDQKDFERFQEHDTLLKAKTLNLKLNVVDLLRDRITIKQISVKKGSLTLLFDKHGHNNYHILKSTKNAKNSNISLNINGIKIENTVLRIYDLEKKLIVINTIERLKSDGNFSDIKFRSKTNANVMVNQLSIGNINYILGKRLEMKGEIASKSYKQFEFTDFAVTYKSNVIKIDGGFSLSKSFSINASASGKNLMLKEVNELIPHINKSLEKINFEGSVDLKAKATGIWSSKQWPFLYGEFEVRGGKSEILKNKSIASVNLVGSFSNGKGSIANSFVQVESFKVTSSFGDFEGKFTLTNFHKPLVSLSSNFNLFLSALNKAYKIDSLSILDGTIIGNLTANGQIDFKNLSPLRIIRLVNNGNFKLNDIKFPVNNNIYAIRQGEVSFVPSTAKANLNFSSNSINGNVTLSIDNLYDGLMDSMPFSGTITANTSSINFDNLLALNFKADKSNTPGDINVANLSIDVNSKKAVLRGIPITELSAKIEKSGTTITVNSLKGKSLGGSIDLIGKLELNNNKTINSNLYVNTDSINIETLFHSFKDFGQKTLSSSNIKGTASGDVAFKGTFTEKGELIYKTVDCVANVEIFKGRLVNFTPAQKLSRFIDLKELEDIQFANLKNQITIRNSVVNIPAMYVASSAINLGVIGTHSFEGDYSYRVKLSLKDILFKKARKGLKKQVSQSDFENNTLLYFKIEGNNKTSKVSYDWSGKSWDLPLPIQKGTTTVPNAASNSKPYKVTWDDEQQPEKAPKNQPAKTTAEQPIPSSYKEEKEAEKKAQKKKETKGGFKVTWEDE